MSIRAAISALALTLALPVLAQDPLVEALRNYQEGRLATARALIDEAVETGTYAQDPEAWLLRGFVFKDLYKAAPHGSEADQLRETALQSLMLCMSFDVQRTYRDNAVQAYDFVAKTFFNDAAKALNSGQEELAIAKFARFKSAMLQLEPTKPLTDREIQFKNALGTSYTKRYNQDRDSTVWYDMAVTTYQEVLDLDSSNYGANYNLATLFYNRGVYNIQKIDPEYDIPSIQEIQTVSKEYFQLALPYMLKAHEMRPDRRETLLGLEGIYYSLQDGARSEEFRLRYESLPPDDGN